MAFKYDENGHRQTRQGNFTTKMADDNLLSNLRFKFKDLLDPYTDEQIVDSYDDYALSDDWGDEQLWYRNWLVI